MRFVLILAISLLTACASSNKSDISRSSVKSYEPQGTTTENKLPPDSPCIYQQTNQETQQGTIIEAGYYCTPLLKPGYLNQNPTADNIVTTPGCTYFPSYTKKDGTQIGPYVRCKSVTDTIFYKTATSTYEAAPCTTSYCGPVSVKGYYRKDGTYVAPYTRRRGGKR